jgi:hypothetical protein
MKSFKIISAVCAAAFFLLNIRARASEADAIKPGTLAHHLATNAAARAAGLTPDLETKLAFHAPVATNALQFERITNAAWSTHFWLKNVSGLTATPIGYRTVLGGPGLPTMISPRHYLCATHMHPEITDNAYLDTNHVTYWRKTVQRIDLTHDTTVGILDQDLPPAVGFLPVLPANFTNYLPLGNRDVIQGIGMNQEFTLFSQPLNFANDQMVAWNPGYNVPGGLNTNWNVSLRSGDSSAPVMILVGNQLVLVAHNFFATAGPNYAYQIPLINQAMRELSKKNHARSDYQLTEFSLTNWPVVR